MAGEDDIARNAAKEFLDRRAADKAAEFAAVPDTVLDKQAGQALRVVAVIGIAAVVPREEPERP